MVTNLEKAAYEARIKELREALVSVREQVWLSDARRVASEALATPDDSSALDAALETERENAITAIAYVLPTELFTVAMEAIRSMK